MTDTNFPGFAGLDFEILIFHDFLRFALSRRTVQEVTGDSPGGKRTRGIKIQTRHITRRKAMKHG